MKKNMRGLSLYPCNEYAYAVGCYRYKVQRLFNLPGEWKQAESFCSSRSGSQRLGCFHGLGFGAFKMVYGNPRELVTLCGQEHPDDRKMCIEGAIDAVGFQDMARARRACESYENSFREQCRTALTYMNFAMERDERLYVEDAKSKRGKLP